ncbi:MAG: hypothetical protein GF311_10715 [Candidatus Lokiarchaeota archaeon]|nr:hypothetical protein [Candidatus Lokiarchaeota archaeon]
MTEIMEKYEGKSIPSEEKKILQSSRPSSRSEDFYEHIFDTLDSLKLVPFNLELYKDEEYQEKEILQRNRGIIAMLRTTLLKRMESSLISFMESIETQIKLCVIFENLLEKNYVATSQFIDKLEEYIEKISEEDDEVEVELDLLSFDKLKQFADRIKPEELEDMRKKQLTQEELEERDEKDKYFNYLKKINPEEFIEDYQEKMISDVKYDQEKFEELLNQTRDILDEGDFKLEELKSTITSLLENAHEENERKIVIFSYFRTTADYIFEELINDNSWNMTNDNPVIKKITGDTPTTKRIDYVERFAPNSCLLELKGPTKVNKKKELEDKEKINILVSTDVLSEGQNLQDGRYVINYDLHWNPVRMIQRSGRIDRLGALHDKVGIFNFFPQTGLERLIHLIERLRRRLTTIDNALGLDADTLDDGDAKKRRRVLEERKKREQEKQTRDEIQRIEEEDENIIEEFEERMEFGGTDLAKIKLFSEIKRQGYEYYRNEVPLGIHSGLVDVSYSGYIVVVSIKNQDVEQLKWMFWSEDEKFRKNLEHNYGLLIDKPKVERMLDNVVSEWEEIKKARYEQQPRIIKEEPQELFRKVIHIIRRFKKAQKKDDKLANLKNKKPIKGNGIYHRFLNKAIQKGLIKKKFASKFQQLLLQKSIKVLAKEEDVADIIDEFNKTRDKIEKVRNDPKIDELEKEEIINGLYRKGAIELLERFYKYMEKTGLKVREIKKSKIENENLKLVGFIRLYKIDNEMETDYIQDSLR